ncbi:MAG TPA: hypothetical protein VLV15_04195, partial [Dongiaceae bacterium]|nr:hypothetical protein [Dongiaceae bacterium]
RHERLVFPLLRRRALFAEARAFRLYDFFTDAGVVDENVFAYSNGRDHERALVLYHNRYASTAGWVRWSCAMAVREPDGVGKTLRRETLADALGLPSDPACWVRFRDHAGGLEYLRSAGELRERGLWVQLDAYRCHVFLDFHLVRDDPAHPWARLAARLGGRGSHHLDHELTELALEPVRTPWRALLDPAVAGPLLAGAARRGSRRVRAVSARSGTEAAPPAAVEPLVERFAVLAERVAEWTGLAINRDDGRRILRAGLTALHESTRRGGLAAETLAVAYAYALLHALFAGETPERVREWVEGWRWGETVSELAGALGAGHDAAQRAPRVLSATLGRAGRLPHEFVRHDAAGRVIAAWAGDPGLAGVLGVHEHGGTRWFHRESWDELVDAMCAVAVIHALADGEEEPSVRARRAAACRRAAGRLKLRAERVGYRWDDLVPRSARSPRRRPAAATERR